MEKSQNTVTASNNTPKRGLLNSDEEFSPESTQPQKLQKKMDISSSDWQEVLAGIRKIQSIEHNLTSVMQNMTALAKSEELEPLRNDIAEIKGSQLIIQDKIVSIERRVTDLENEVDSIKNNDVNGIISEVDEIRTCTQQLSQINLNNFLIIRHFPIEIKNDRKELCATVQKIFAELQFDIHPNEYDATAMKVRNKELAFIQLKFSSQLLKSKVLSKFRQMKKIEGNEPNFVVEKLTGLPADHALNGTLISMHNRLTKHNIQLLQTARTHVPKYFDFVFDDADGRILAKSGNSFINIGSTEDIEDLIIKIERTKRPPIQSQVGRSDQTASVSGPRRGRSARGGASGRR